MGTFCNLFIAVLMLGCMSACNSGVLSPAPAKASSPPIQTVSRITNAGSSAVLNTGNSSECVNYVKGRTFIGENFRLKFDHDGNVSAYGHHGQLVFGGTLELGATESHFWRWGPSIPAQQRRETDGAGEFDDLSTGVNIRLSGGDWNVLRSGQL